MSTPTEADAGTQQVDSSDEEAAAQYQRQLSAIIAAVLSQEATGESDSQVQKAVALAITAIVLRYALRSSTGFAQDAGALDPSGAEKASRVAQKVAEAETARLAQHAAEGARTTDQAAIDAGTTGVPDRRLEAELTKVQTDRLAQSSATGLREAAKQALAELFGGVTKTWHTVHDNKVRSAHQLLEGQTVPVSEPFIEPEGARAIRFPGDPEADIDLTAGCRCHLSWELPK